MTDRFVAAQDGPLLELLARHLPTWSRNTLRERLRLGCVLVNGAAVADAREPLRAGDTVEIAAKAAGEAALRRAHGPPFLFADDDLVAIDKPAGLLSVATDDERERTALARVRESLSAPGRPASLWPVHRLDRETSGVLLFARSREACDAVQDAWRESRKVYDAVVEGRPEPPAGRIDAPLWEDENLRVHVGAHADARPARTDYTTLAARGGRSHLEVELHTGRKHQIRAHLAWLGHPVVGDRRYGSAADRLCLHARRLEVPHPRTGERLVLEAPVPRVLLDALRR